MTATQRIRQGIDALLAFSRPVDLEFAGRYLNQAELALFRRMSRSEQLHSLNVLRDVLLQETNTPPELAAAALLHDVGKSRYKLAIWQKTLSVLVDHFLPALAARLSAEDRLTFWRAPFVVRHYHPAWSADLLRTLGASERTVWLAAYHADPLEEWRSHPDYVLLERLQRADNQN